MAFMTIDTNDLKKEELSSPNFIANFRYASQEHYHFEKDEEAPSVGELP